MKAIADFVKKVLLTTGITLTLLACFAQLAGGTAIYVQTVFQGLLANTFVHLAFLLTTNFESKYFLLDAALDITASAVVILAAGAVFGWFLSTPIWVLLIMTVITYLGCCTFQIVRVKDDRSD